MHKIYCVTGGDGVPLISASHPLATGGTFSNVLATAADLNETSLEQSLIDIAGFVDERGLKIAATRCKNDNSKRITIYS